MVRYKARYILFNVLYPTAPSTGKDAPKAIDFLAPSDGVTPSELATLIRNTIATEYGDWGSGVAGNLSVKYFSTATSTGIVRVGRDNYRVVWGALTQIREIKGRPVVIRVVKVSGTIKKAELEAIRRARNDIDRIQAEAQGKRLPALENMLGISIEDDEEEEEN
ncbi:Rpp14/Pop5 family-domain-containing protein [Geopyxis carbonaria]|nr:Rpp14/Pop5 family-domain-containing protein [Geopyxis carbonaria]